MVHGLYGLPSIFAATPSISLTLTPQPVLHCRQTVLIWLVSLRQGVASAGLGCLP
jgi:hypothetical protein